MATYVYSTLTSTQHYHLHSKGLQGVPGLIRKTITIKGGANVVNAKTLLTPRGAVTVLRDEDYEILKNDYSFKNHVKYGFIQVEKHAEKIDKVVADLEPRDASAQKLKGDFKPNKPPEDQEVVIYGGEPTLEVAPVVAGRPPKPGRNKGDKSQEILSDDQILKDLEN